MAATVRQFPADVVVRPNGDDRETAGDRAVALVWLLALTGKSTLSFGKRINKETVCEALEKIREQNLPDRILLVADNYGSHHAKLTQQRADELGEWSA